MSKRNLLAGLLIVGATSVLATHVSAATQGLYLFDSINNPTPAVAPFEEMPDTSGNALDLVKQDAFGAVSLDTDRPGVMPAGTFALNSAGGGTGSIITGNTDLYSVKKSNGLTVEFWYKPQVAGLKYILEFGDEGANGWEIYQETSGDDVTIRAALRTNANAFFAMSSGVQFDLANPEWKHIAMTMDATGANKLYINGVEEGAAGYGGDLSLFDVQSSFLRLGADTNASLSNTFLIDELRISDVALLPGAGTGVGELAHNASLVPEPASLALLGLGGLMMIRRRTRK